MEGLRLRGRGARTRVGAWASLRVVHSDAGFSMEIGQVHVRGIFFLFRVVVKETVGRRHYRHPRKNHCHDLPS